MDILKQIAESEAKIKGAQAEGTITASGKQTSSFRWASTKNKEYYHTENLVEETYHCNAGSCSSSTIKVQPPYISRKYHAFDGSIVYSLYETPNLKQENEVMRPVGPLQAHASISPYFRIDSRSCGLEIADTPRKLLGHHISQDRRANFSEKFSTAKTIRILDESALIDNHPCTVLQGEFTLNEYCQIKIIAWIDTRRDSRILHLEYYYHQPIQDQLLYRINNIQLDKIDGIWFPIAGQISWYRRKGYWIADGRDLDTFSKEERDDIEKRCGHLSIEEQSKLIRLETCLLNPPRQINLTNIRLNQGIPDEKFVITFPLGCRVYDAFQNKIVEPEK
jgi:hypothetical protein